MIAIIKYNAGNVLSVKNALGRLGQESIITDNLESIQKADKVIFPGVGEASTAMNYIKGKQLDKAILNCRQPFLGICLGLQLMCLSSDEGKTQCLGIFNNKVKLFKGDEKVPHMGWNNFESNKGSLFKGITIIDDVYYVHSYYAEIGKATAAVCNYLLPFSAALQKDNFYATQFHPEKSAAIGDKILQNFLSL